MKYCKIIYYILVIVLLLYIIFNIKYTTLNDNDREFINKIELLELKIDSLKSLEDSLKVNITHQDKQIINNEKYFKETITNIITQPQHYDSIFARNYIQKFINERIR